MLKFRALLISIVSCAAVVALRVCSAQAPSPPPVPHGAPPEKVIIDTDIGDDVDDAFAVALALRSPELEILGITTTFGDTETRAKLLDRFLAEAGRPRFPLPPAFIRRLNPTSPSAATPRTTTTPRLPTRTP
jgi:hypothetical protein